MKLVVPEFPSFAVAFPIVSVGSASSFVIVPVPTPVPAMVAFVGFDRFDRERLVRLDRRCRRSPATTICFAVCPGVKVSVPELAA